MFCLFFDAPKNNKGFIHYKPLKIVGTDTWFFKGNRAKAQVVFADGLSGKPGGRPSDLNVQLLFLIQITGKYHCST